MVVFCALAAGLGASVGSRLSAGGYDVPGAHSTVAANVLAARFGAGELNLVLVVATPAGPDNPATAARGIALAHSLARQRGVQEVQSYWSSSRNPALRSARGDSALVVAHLTGSEDQVQATVDALAPRYQRGFDGLALRIGGAAEANRELTAQTQRDLTRAEILVFPLTLILLLFVFRSVMAALIPLGLGVVAILCTLAVLRGLVAVTSVSVYAMNLTTALGFGLGIDYSLFMVTRFREELANGSTVQQAITTAVRTAGRTILFSALTVSLSLSALLIFPMYFLRSFAYAGIPVVLFAALAALLVLPALLAVLGHRVNKWPVGPRRRIASENSFWRRLATLATRRPLRLAGPVLVLLVVAGIPFLGIKFGLTDERGLPATAPAHQVYDILARDYPAQVTTPILVVADGIGSPQRHLAEIGGYAARLSRLPGVARVDALTGSYAAGRQVAPASAASRPFGTADGTWLSVVPTASPYSAAGQRLVTQVRATPSGFGVLVGGAAATLQDTMTALGARLPAALAIIAVSTFAVIFLLSGSVIMPLLALLLNLLSLSVAFGAMVWIFQDGHLRWLVGSFTVTGTVAATMPIMMFCVAFGLSMDYEVFVLSRIREEYEQSGGDHVRAVIRGLTRTGGLVTAAALLVALVFASFITSNVAYMKLLGLGLAVTVLVDATLVRGVLLPAIMRLAGQSSWWAPGPLARLRPVAGRESAAAPPGRAGSQPPQSALRAK